MELTTTNNRVPNSGSWQPGQSGNLNGRPIGSRHVFSKAFLRDLAEVWSAEGRQAMLITAKTQPGVFFATCARLLPAQVQLDVQATYGGLSADDMAILQAIKEAIPDANSRSSTDVLAYVRDTLRSADAKLIEAPRNIE